MEHYAAIGKNSYFDDDDDDDSGQHLLSAQVPKVVLENSSH